MNYDSIKDLLNLTSITILFTLIIHHLLIFVDRYNEKRETYKLHFCLFSFFSILYIFIDGGLIRYCASGYIIQLISPSLLVFSILGMFYGFIHFMISILDLAKNLNKRFIIAYIPVIIAFVLTVANPIFGNAFYKTYLYVFTFLCVFTGVLILVSLSLNLIIKGKKYRTSIEKFFFTGFLIIIFFYTSNKLFFLLNTGYFMYGNYISIGITSFLFVHALAKTINKEHKDLIELKINLEEKIKDKTFMLEDANKKLKSLDKLKNDFITNITHDFRSPLTVILNTADLSIKNNSNNNDTVNYELIYKASLKLKDSIDRLLNLTKLEAKGICLSITKTNPVALLNSIIDFYTSALNNSGIKILNKITFKNIDNFFIDKDKFEEIINNILSNAIKFVNNENGLIGINLIDSPEFIEIIISDNGIGIASDKLKIIFNRFEQLNEGIKNYGTGIGLSFSKQLVEYMNGKIWAYSDGENTGAEFHIKFRKSMDHFNKKDLIIEEQKFFTNRTNDKIRNEIIKFDISKKMEKDGVFTFLNDIRRDNDFNYKKAKILIIDDDINISKITMGYLKNNGYNNFIISTTGKLGLESLYKYKPEMIICDYNLPDMKGSQIHNEILSDKQMHNIPFIFLSAVSDNKHFFKSKKTAAIAYLNKPIDENDMITKIDQHLKTYFDFLRIYNLKENN